jgi:acyl carrier protein
MEQTVEQKVMVAVAQVLKKELDSMSLHQPFVELGVDDLDMFELILKIEDTFLLEIGDDDAQQFISVAHIVSYVTARLVQ